MLSTALPACAADPPRKDPALPTGVAPPTRIPRVASLPVEPAGEPVATTALPRELRRAVAADAAKRLQVAARQVVLTAAERVTWADASLGCPEPGKMYTQALVPGFRVVARAPSGQLVYHTDERARFATCEVMAMSPAPAPER